MISPPTSQSPKMARKPKPSSFSSTVRPYTHSPLFTPSPLTPLPSLRLRIQKRPAPSRQLRQSRVLRLHPGRASGKQYSAILSAERGAASANPRATVACGENQSYGRGGYHVTALARQTSRGRHKTAGFLLYCAYPRCARDGKGGRVGILLGRKICDIGCAWRG